MAIKTYTITTQGTISGKSYKVSDTIQMDTITAVKFIKEKIIK